MEMVGKKMCGQMDVWRKQNSTNPKKEKRSCRREHMAGAQEADGIVIDTLRDIGCKLGKDFQSLKQVNCDILTEAVSRCINLIEDNGDAIPNKIPRGVAKRHRYCTLLGEKMKGLGFNGDCGFQQFMYPNVRDSRKMLVFCVNKLPKAEEEGEEEVSDGAELNRTIRAALKKWGATFWRQDGHEPRHIVNASPLEIVDSKLSENSSPMSRYYVQFLPLVSDQPRTNWDIAASVFEYDAEEAAVVAAREAAWGDEESDPERQKAALTSALRSAFVGAPKEFADVGSDVTLSNLPSLDDILSACRGDGTRSNDGSDMSSRFGNERMFSTESTAGATVPDDVIKTRDDDSDAAVDPVEAAKQRRLAQKEKDERQFAEWEAELEALSKKLADAVSDAANDVSSKEAAETTCRRLNSDLMKSLEDAKRLEAAYRVKERTLKMLPDASNNIIKLRAICNKSATGLVKLSAEWEKFRRTLVESYRHMKESHTLRKHACKQKVKEMKEMRAEMKGMSGELRQKEARLKFLLKEFAKMPKSVNRSLYTSRIMGIIEKVRKQNDEIENVIEQIRDVQGEINEVGQKLLRTEKLTDRRMYEVASRSNDPAYVDAYRHLKDIRDAFEKLVVNVQSIGRLDNEMVVTRARIAQLKAQNTDENMRQIQKDLAEVKKENASLQKQLS